MNLNVIDKKKSIMSLVVLAMASLVCFSACTGSTGTVTCDKCIDHKPAPTPFSTTLNGINHAIPMDQALTMVRDFGKGQDSILAPQYKGLGTLPSYETFNLKAIDSLICQKNAIGFRIYLAMDGQKKVRMVLVGVDGDGKDIIQRSNEQPGMSISSFGDVSILVDEAGQRWP